MRELRSLRAIAAASVALVVLLALELPAMAYPGSPPSRVSPEVTGVKHRLTATLFVAGVPGLRPIQLRRTVAASEAEDDEAWTPTLPEGAAFTVIGASLICAGGVVFGAGMAQLAPTLAEYGGLVTAAVGPLVLAGVGLTLLFVGIPLLIHGIETLKVVRAAEQDGVGMAWHDVAGGPHVSSIRQTILVRF